MHGCLYRELRCEGAGRAILLECARSELWWGWEYDFKCWGEEGSWEEIVGFCFGWWVGFFGVVMIGGLVLFLHVDMHFSAIYFWLFLRYPFVIIFMFKLYHE